MYAERVPNLLYNKPFSSMSIGKRQTFAFTKSKLVSVWSVVKLSVNDFYVIIILAVRIGTVIL
jgi:hypothetical protein